MTPRGAPKPLQAQSSAASKEHSAATPGEGTSLGAQVLDLADKSVEGTYIPGGGGARGSGGRLGESPRRKSAGGEAWYLY